MRRREALVLMGAAAAGRAAAFEPAPWALQSSVYEVNVRQYTREGTFAAFESQLPRLAQMGVGMLWFMPIQPIGAKHRKGTLGSYYSVSDYTAVNPEFGTLADFRRVVDRAHALGMKVLLDWVANHTAWDHAWTTQHRDWYLKNAQGEIEGYVYRHSPGSPPETWDDVVGLDWRQSALWPAMTDAMLWWMREAAIDGFRCDVAANIPEPFWANARKALERVRPVFLLAESDAPALHERAFDATYDFRLYDTLKQVARGGGAAPLHAWWQERQAKYPPDAMRLTYSANHDTNSWHDHDVAHYGPALQAVAVLAATLPGIPLVYGGQEAVLDRKLAFFEKDLVPWKTLALQDFYTRLLQLRRRHPGLRHDAPLAWISPPESPLLRYRRGAETPLTVTVNLGPAPAGRLPGWGWAIDA